MEWNGMEWNGMEWNGMEWNGTERNGTEWNGMASFQPAWQIREREKERGLHLSSHTGLMQVLPGHPLADAITVRSITG